MLNKEQVKAMLIFDLEASSNFPSYAALKENDPILADVFERRTWPKIKENANETIEDSYCNGGVLLGEYNRILCGSFGMITFVNNTPTINIANISGTDEKEVLTKISKLMDDFSALFTNKSETGKLNGFNVKGWDIPVLCKRMIINGVQLPKILDTGILKPWEVPHLDVSEQWNFGNRRSSSLELALAALGIDSSKDDIYGGEVSNLFHTSKNKLEAIKRISTYCSKDVIATARLLLKINGLEDIDIKNNVLIKDI